MNQRLLTLPEAAQMLRISPLTLSDKRFRRRLGLPGIKIGRAVMFKAEDLDMIILRLKEFDNGE